MNIFNHKKPTEATYFQSNSQRVKTSRLSFLANNKPLVAIFSGVIILSVVSGVVILQKSRGSKAATTTYKTLGWNVSSHDGFGSDLGWNFQNQGLDLIATNNAGENLKIQYKPGVKYTKGLFSCWVLPIKDHITATSMAFNLTSDAAGSTNVFVRRNGDILWQNSRAMNNQLVNIPIGGTGGDVSVCHQITPDGTANPTVLKEARSVFVNDYVVHGTYQQSTTTPDTYTVSGYIKGPDGEGVSGVQLFYCSNGDAARSGAEGYYQFTIVEGTGFCVRINTDANGLVGNSAYTSPNTSYENMVANGTPEQRQLNFSVAKKPVATPPVGTPATAGTTASQCPGKPASAFCKNATLKNGESVTQEFAPNKAGRYAATVRAKGAGKNSIVIAKNSDRTPGKNIPFKADSSTLNVTSEFNGQLGISGNLIQLDNNDRVTVTVFNQSATPLTVEWLNLDYSEESSNKPAGSSNSPTQGSGAVTAPTQNTPAAPKPTNVCQQKPDHQPGKTEVNAVNMLGTGLACVADPSTVRLFNNEASVSYKFVVPENGQYAIDADLKSNMDGFSPDEFINKFGPAEYKISISGRNSKSGIAGRQSDGEKAMKLALIQTYAPERIIIDGNSGSEYLKAGAEITVSIKMTNDTSGNGKDRNMDVGNVKLVKLKNQPGSNPTPSNGTTPQGGGDNSTKTNGDGGASTTSPVKCNTTPNIANERIRIEAEDTTDKNNINNNSASNCKLVKLEKNKDRVSAKFTIPSTPSKKYTVAVRAASNGATSQVSVNNTEMDGKFTKTLEASTYGGSKIYKPLSTVDVTVTKTNSQGSLEIDWIDLIASDADSSATSNPSIPDYENLSSTNNGNATSNPSSNDRCGTQSSISKYDGDAKNSNCDTVKDGDKQVVKLSKQNQFIEHSFAPVSEDSDYIIGFSLKSKGPRAFNDVARIFINGKPQVLYGQEGETFYVNSADYYNYTVRFRVSKDTPTTVRVVFNNPNNMARELYVSQSSAEKAPEGEPDPNSISREAPNRSDSVVESLTNKGGKIVTFIVDIPKKMATAVVRLFDDGQDVKVNEKSLVKCDADPSKPDSCSALYNNEKYLCSVVIRYQKMSNGSYNVKEKLYSCMEKIKEEGGNTKTHVTPANTTPDPGFIQDGN